MTVKTNMLLWSQCHLRCKNQPKHQKQRSLTWNWKFLRGVVLSVFHTWVRVCDIHPSSENSNKQHPLAHTCTRARLMLQTEDIRGSVGLSSSSSYHEDSGIQSRGNRGQVEEYRYKPRISKNFYWHVSNLHFFFKGWRRVQGCRLQRCLKYWSSYCCICSRGLN